MHTLLNRFCEEFVRIVRPLRNPLVQTAEAIAAAGDGTPGREIHSEFLDLRSQFDLLADKVADQQAYVLIFGPLKSGKSTLMNAICASYVSEVSSLPAYPCMVFVSHSPVREYTVTDYTGKTRTFADPVALQKHVDQAHRELASRIRKAEEGQQDFDPQRHFPEAIRRVDVKVPAGDLAQSSAVLVDTPGLYSRMKFGYDRMTRDFRNAAACAVFVVRSDNLFLEQVFAEFTQLLELFSRIFLVVNLDTAKQDLSPDGKLVPSLENKNPRRLIEAFENLTMSAPLKDAADEGRLRIYPIGLLHSASGRLLKESGDAESDSPQSDDFDCFLGDLTDYLNSTDYLLAFLGDSLRRAGNLLQESAELCNHESIRKLGTELGQLEDNLKEKNGRLDAHESLAAFDWIQNFRALQKQLVAAIDKQAPDIGYKTSRRIEQDLSKWFKSKASLQDLVKGELIESYTRYQEDLVAAVGREVSDQIVKGNAGITVSQEALAAAEVADIDLSAIGRKAHHRTDRNALITVPPTPLKSEHIPVRKTFWDWLLFRSKSGVRARLFGPGERPNIPVSKERKSIRLGETAKQAIQQRLKRYESDLYAQSLDRMRKGFIGGYCRGAVAGIRAEIKRGKQALELEIAELEARIHDARAIIQPIEQLLSEGETARKSVEKLAEHYTEVDLFMLTQPADASYVLPSKSENPADAAPAVVEASVEEVRAVESEDQRDSEDQRVSGKKMEPETQSFGVSSIERPAIDLETESAPANGHDQAK